MHKSLYKDFCFTGFNVPFNTFQVILERCLLVTDHIIVLSHWNITHQAQLYDITPRLHYSGNRSTRLKIVFNYPLYVEHLAREPTNLKSLVWLGQVLNPGPPKHEVDALPLGYQCWSYIKTTSTSNTYSQIMMFPLPCLAESEYQFPFSCIMAI